MNSNRQRLTPQTQDRSQPYIDDQLELPHDSGSRVGEHAVDEAIPTLAQEPAAPPLPVPPDPKPQASLKVDGDKIEGDARAVLWAMIIQKSDTWLKALLRAIVMLFVITSQPLRNVYDIVLCYFNSG